MAPHIAVVGSANLDIVVPVPHHPSTGETVLGGDHQQVPGGKGANQAVAAARLGAQVSFVGMVGDDDAGAALRSSLTASGVDVSGLGTSLESPSGIALITVDTDGDNAITVSPGANTMVTPDWIRSHPEILDAAVVQLQLEIPIETVAYVAANATGVVVLDPAPAPDGGLPREVLDNTTVLVPNETELALLSGFDTDPTHIDQVVTAARSLAVDTVVVTLGAHGAVVVADGVAEHVPAPTISAVDTTAAGDAFRSALAVRLADGANIVEAAKFAVRVGAATALSFGAQPSLPTPAQVDERLA